MMEEGSDGAIETSGFMITTKKGGRTAPFANHYHEN
jgi:hypothetical protein